MIPRGARKPFAALIVAVTAACDGPVEPRACNLPSVTASTVSGLPANVLAAAVKTNVTSADSVIARFSRAGDAGHDETPSFDAVRDTLTIPVLGLHSETRYTVTVVAFNACGASESEPLDLATGALPADLPRFSASGRDPAPGYVAFAAGNYGLVIDNAGRVVWYHHFPEGPGLNFQPQPNGRYVARPTPAFGSQARWIEIDALGRTKLLPGCTGGLNTRMHDMIALSDSTYWIMCDATRTVDLSEFGLSASSLVTGTSVQRLNHDGSVLFEWSPFDHFTVDPTVLEPADLTTPAINWTHGNAIDLDGNGNLLISFRNLNEITSIDARTGSVRWRLGGQHNAFTFADGTSRPFARQHAVRSIGSGQLQLLDNLGDPASSRTERYSYDESAMTVRLEASYQPASSVVALTGGTAQTLREGRMLVSFGSGGKVEEVDAGGNVMWKIDGNPGYVFRAHRIQSLYTPGKGDTR